VQLDSYPYTRIYFNTGIPIEEYNLVEFRLLYSGQLLSSNNEGNPAEKHAIRRIFHPQLRRLWSLKPTLQMLARNSAQGVFAKVAAIRHANKPDLHPDHPERKKEDQKLFQMAVKIMAKKYARAGYNILPLVTKALVLQCSIEILLLRPEEERFVFERGDIDGQVRTLIDALRRPDSPDETGHAVPTADEDPLFCLLEDDKLISEVKVTSDQLLMLPEQRGNLNAHQESIARINIMLGNPKWDFDADDRKALETARKVLQVRGDVRPYDASVVINVRLNHREPRTFDNYFGN
jgi:hypothetical protein